MKNILFIGFLTIQSFVFLSCGGKTVTEQNGAIDKMKAIEIAEIFIQQQGYTTNQNQVRMDKIQFEAEEYASDVNVLVKNRKNLLQSKAYGARPYKSGSAWCVGFAYVNEVDNIGRWVGMDSLGHNLFMNDEVRLNWIDEYWQNL